jgi:hypothetical protein
LAVPLFVVPSAGGGSATPPTITLTIYGTAGQNGWYVSAVTVNWTVTGADSSQGCDAVTLRDDTPGTKLTCTASQGGDSTTVSKTFKIDKTPPVVSPAASRPPDANGWYNHPLSVAFTGTDATAGIAGCSSADYGGPDNANAVVGGSCTDLAGNVGRASLPLQYDATPPVVKRVVAKTGNQKVDLGWAGSTDVASFTVARTGVARGARTVSTATIYTGHGEAFRDRSVKVGARYRYVVTAYDQAANSASKAVVVTATGALLSPPPGARVGSAPMLTWTAARGAAYYNLQLVRGRKIFSAWPRSPHFRLPRSWVFGGRRYHLHRGVYKWYVWPGFGKFTAARYGNLLGGSSFVFSG